MEFVGKFGAPAALAAGFVCAGLYAIVSMWLPLGWDHGFMASTADTILRGGALYKDAWEIKGPVAYAPFVLARALFGNEMWGVRLVDFAIVAGLLYVFYRQLSFLTNRFVGVAASLALYLWFASAGWFFTAQPEVWVALAVSAAMGLVLVGAKGNSPSLARMAGVGVLIACTGLVKPFFLAFGLAPLIYLAVASDLAWRRRFMLAVALAAGALAPILAAALYFLATGSLGALYEIQVEFNLGTYASVGYDLSPGLVEEAVTNFFRPGLVTLLLPFACVGLWSQKENVKICAPLLAWLALAFLCILAQGKFYTYHWFPFYPPLLVCAALGAHAAWVSSASAPAARIAIGAAALLFGVQCAEQPARTSLAAVRYAIGPKTENFYDQFVFMEYRASDQVLAAQYIRDHTDPEQGVFVWGNDATTRFLSNRANPTRFPYVLALNLEGSLRDAYRAEVMNDLRAAPPAYVVIGMPWHAGVKAEETLAGFPEFKSYLDNGYVYETSFGFLKLYRRADGAGVEAE